MNHLIVLDIFFTLLHLVIIGFNLTGWIWKGTRTLHLITIIVTAISWVILGFWFGFGYCFITDWQWRIKEKLGETHLPASFIKYFLDKVTRHSFDAGFVDLLTLIGFLFSIIMALYFYLTKRFFHFKKG